MDVVKSTNGIIALVVIAVVASILIGAMSGLLGIFEHEVETTPGQLSNVSEASYIIYQDGDYNCIKNGSTGRIIERSLNFSEILSTTIYLANSSDGGIIHIRTGTYEMDNGIVVKNIANVTITGDGAGSNIIAGPSNDDTMIHIWNSANVTISSVCIDANRDDRPGVNTSLRSNLLMWNCKSLIVQDVIFLDSPKNALEIFGATINGVDGVQVDGCKFINSGGSAIAVNANGMKMVYGIQIKDCYIDTYNAINTLRPGIETYLARDIVITGNIVKNMNKYDDLAAGIRVLGHVSETYGSSAIVSNNICDDTNSPGILIQNTYGAVVDGNQCNNHSEHAGIYVENYGNALVSDNRCSNNGNGIYVVGYSALPSESKISNNFVSNNRVSGIHTDSDHVTLIGNTAKNNAQNATFSALYPYRAVGIIAWGKYCVVSNNICFDDQSTKTQNYGFSDYNDVGNIGSHSLVTGNDFRANIAAAYIAGANQVIKNNLGYVTEWSGTANIVGSTTVTFDHGLSAAPTFVIASFNSTAYTSYSWTTTLTQITITVASSGTFTVYWYAEV